ncbi:amidoligase family protein [Oceaniglobus roseus]|uniref:amidoligase family protein n=1 Tax=Oceaniglobus roseus TaxID=1737570 RepID=UPI000C7F13C2|nr:amidoligase family protein [Kandeliimicrobium roseum]
MTQPFAPLPRPETSDSSPRKTGVEIELAGLDEAQTAKCVADVLGGIARQTDSVKWLVEGTELGDIEVYLDIFLRDATKSALRDAVLDAGRDLVPVEIVSPPLDRDGLVTLDRCREKLREAGALGTGAGVLYGFGVHLNPEIASTSARDVVGPLVSYALLEAWIRDTNPIDPTRRLLPFTDPYPAALVDALVGLGSDPDIDTAIDIYLKHAASRNYGLDMLPAFAHIDEPRVKAKMGKDQAVRPTFHYRLPDCRIDEPDWSLDDSWRDWRHIEEVAGDAALMAALRDAWRHNREQTALLRPSWAHVCGDVLRDHDAARIPA